MIIPVRCFTCGKVIGNKWEKWLSMQQDGMDPGMVLDKLGLTRICCRRMLISHVDMIDTLLLYSEQGSKSLARVQMPEADIIPTMVPIVHKPPIQPPLKLFGQEVEFNVMVPLVHMDPQQQEKDSVMTMDE